MLVNITLLLVCFFKKLEVLHNAFNAKPLKVCNVDLNTQVILFLNDNV